MISLNLQGVHDKTDKSMYDLYLQFRSRKQKKVKIYLP